LIRIQRNDAQGGKPTRRLIPTKISSAKKLNGSHPIKQIDSAAIAKDWLSLGILPVPLAKRSKKPVGGKGWNKMRVTEDAIERFFYRGYNVGGLWGEPSGWVVDIDLDTEEACLAARRMLPETFIYGRKSAPGSHYLYRCEGINTRKFQTPEIGTIAEIRSTGTQSVLPPSIHPSSEPYEIYHDTAFKRIPRSRLELLIRHVSAAALAAICWPTKGSRHDFLVALSGALCWNGWDSKEILHFTSATLDAAASDGEDRTKHERTISNVLKNFKEGNKIPGWPALSQWISGDNLRCLREWIGGKKSEEEMPPDEGDEPGDDAFRIDPRLLQVPGLVGEISTWASKRSFSNQPLFNLAAGLSTVALCSRNNYIVDYWDTPLQPYFLLIAPTASGKESAMDSVFLAARRVGLGENVFKGFQSYHAMLDTLANPPSAALMLWDECARKLKSAARSTGGQDYAIVTHLLEMYGKGASSIPGLPARKNAIKSIDYPFFSVLAAAQPGHLLEALTEAELQLGLVNRFILLDAGEKMPRMNEARDHIFPSRIEDKLLAFKAIKRPHADLPFRRIRFESTKVWGQFNDFYLKCRESAASGGTSEIWGRANQNALIVAGIVAVGINAEKPMITEEIATWATRFLTWTSESWVRRVEQSSARNSTERGSKFIERIITHVREHQSRARSPVEHALVKRGLLPKSMLMRLSRYIRGRELDEILTNLILGDLIATGDIDGKTCYWPKRIKNIKKLEKTT